MSDVEQATVAEDLQRRIAELERENAELKEKIYTKAISAGEFFFKAKDYDAAILEYLEAIELKPDYKEIRDKCAEAYYNLGLGFLNRKDYNTAIENFNEAINLKSDYKEARDNLEKAINLKKEHEKFQKQRFFTSKPSALKIIGNVVVSDDEYDEITSQRRT